MQGTKPNYNGKLIVDVGPALHRKIGAAAKRNDESMSALVRRTLREALKRKEM